MQVQASVGKPALCTGQGKVEQLSSSCGCGLADEKFNEALFIPYMVDMDCCCMEACEWMCQAIVSLSSHYKPIYSNSYKLKPLIDHVHFY